MLGPHHKLERQLMALGVKVCALIEPWNYDTRWKQLVAARRFRILVVPVLHSEHNIAVTAPGHHWKAQRIEKIYAGCRAKGRMDPIDHARLGLLLGYGKADIREFLGEVEERYVA